MTFTDSPALKSQSRHYPERFGKRVPRRIKMLRNVWPDMTPRSSLVATEGVVYEAWTNSHGAVAAIIEGDTLGVKPDEFEVVEWHNPNSVPASCPADWTPPKDVRYEVVLIKGGHVFVWRTDSRRPSSQVACCLGCGKARHELFPS